MSWKTENLSPCSTSHSTPILDDDCFWHFSFISANHDDHFNDPDRRTKLSMFIDFVNFVGRKLCAFKMIILTMYALEFSSSWNLQCNNFGWNHQAIKLIAWVAVPPYHFPWIDGGGDILHIIVTTFQHFDLCLTTYYT